MSDLAMRECVPCKGGVPPLEGEVLREWAAKLGGCWRVVDAHHLEKTYSFKPYTQCVDFTNRVAALAEQVNHHPDILLAWGKVTVRVWTHKIDGLTESDFIFAAKVDAL